MATVYNFPVLGLLLPAIILFQSCHAHLCLLSPPQRGSMTGINKPGATDCILLKSPCGGRPAEADGVILRQGQEFTVTFQKNLDHWNKNSPGYFSISLGDFSGRGGPFELGRIEDKGEPSLTLYSMKVMMPKVDRMSPGKKVLQVTYTTNNPAAPPVFYQCSDVTLISNK